MTPANKLMTGRGGFASTYKTKTNDSEPPDSSTNAATGLRRGHEQLLHLASRHNHIRAGPVLRQA